MVISLFIAASFYSAAKIRQIASAQRTINELNVIADLSTQYYLENGAWPVNLAGLRPKYLTANAGDLSPFGNAYTITSGASGVSVSTLLPKGLLTNKSFGSEVVVLNQGNNDLVSTTKSPESRTWNLKYEKKYIHKQ